MEYAEMEDMLQNLETIVAEIQERLDALEQILNVQLETLQLQIRNLRD